MMNRQTVIFVCVLAIVLAILIPARKSNAQAVSYDDFSAAGFAGDQLAQAYEHFKRARDLCDDASRRTQTAREKFYGALKSGRSVESARSEFHRLLDEKDLQYIIADVVGGPSSPQAKMIKEKVCPIDGGIDPLLVGAFDALVEELRFEMGARNKDDLIFVSGPRLFGALSTNHQRHMLYVRARNLMELYGSGMPTEKLFSAETYLKILLEFDLSRPAIGVVPPDADTIAQKRYALLVKVFGQKMVLEAIETILTLPKTKAGKLTNVFSLDQIHGTNNPFDAFNEILRSDLKGYVILAAGGALRGGEYSYRITTGFDYYNDLVSSHGENRVIEAANQIWHAQKLQYRDQIPFPDGGGYKLQTLRWWLERLLKDPIARAPRPEDMVFLSATDSAGIARATDKFQVVYGRVTDVRWVHIYPEKITDTDYFYVYFAGANDFAVAVYRHAYDNLDGRFGDDAKGLIGKLFRAEATVFKRHPNDTVEIAPNWDMLANSHTVFSVITEEEWPDYLPIPDMEPARSLEEIKAAQTPLESIPEEIPDLASLFGKRSMMPLNCSGSPRRRGQFAGFKSGSNMQMNRFLSTLGQYGDRVGSFEAISEVCSGGGKPAIRQNFMLAVGALLTPKQVIQITAHMDRGYQGWCRAPGFGVCPERNLKIAQTRYQELMSVLASGDLQRTRDTLVTRDASTQRDPVRSNASKSDPPFTGSILVAASLVGSYQALSESCSGKEETAIRDDFLAIVGELSAERATDLTRRMDGTYEETATAQKNWHLVGRGCPETKLRNWGIRYQNMLNNPKIANWRVR